MKPLSLLALLCIAMLFAGCGATADERAFFNESWMNPKERDPGDTMARFPSSEGGN